MANRTLITVLGWEDRSVNGFIEDFKKYSFEESIIFCYEDYSNVTETNLLKLENFKSEGRFNLNKHFLHSDQYIKNWETISSVITSIPIANELIIDITTIPREVIWIILFFAKERFSKIEYIYHRPLSYSNDWLSREPENPRLLLKHSGVVEFDRPTLLFIITGFDPERTRQLIYFFEPKKTILVIQKGNQFENEHRNNKEAHLEECKGLTDYEDYEIDSYNTQESFEKIKEILSKYESEYNIVASSLGPKLSAIPLYLYYMFNDSIALSYVPCKQYNSEYSSGIDSNITGSIIFEKKAIAESA